MLSAAFLTCIAPMSEDPKIVYDWANEHAHGVNIAKTKAIIFGSSSNIKYISSVAFNESGENYIIMRTVRATKSISSEKCEEDCNAAKSASKTINLRVKGRKL